MLPCCSLSLCDEDYYSIKGFVCQYLFSKFLEFFWKKFFASFFLHIYYMRLLKIFFIKSTERTWFLCLFADVPRKIILLFDKIFPSDKGFFCAAQMRAFKRRLSSLINAMRQLFLCVGPLTWWRSGTRFYRSYLINDLYKEKTC